LVTVASLPATLFVYEEIEVLDAQIRRGTTELPPAVVDLVVMSPPYKRKDGWHPRLMDCVGNLVGHMLKPGGRVFLNFGQLREDYERPYVAAQALARGGNLRFGQTIAWVKSIAIDGHQTGHFQPINSDKILNYCWEPIFTLYKPPEPTFDRLSVGVPYADKSNLARGTRGKNGDLHCAGDVWFVPYSTTGSTTKKAHRHEFPEELVERCIRVANLPPGATVMDPFCGSGTTACVAKRLGFGGITIDRDLEALKGARARWEAQPVAAPRG
jgi:site-specific DNA-methyltransferase (adenine-specific)